MTSRFTQKAMRSYYIGENVIPLFKYPNYWHYNWYYNILPKINHNTIRMTNLSPCNKKAGNLLINKEQLTIPSTNVSSVINADKSK